MLAEFQLDERAEKLIYEGLRDFFIDTYSEDLPEKYLRKIEEYVKSNETGSTEISEVKINVQYYKLKFTLRRIVKAIIESEALEFKKKNEKIYEGKEDYQKKYKMNLRD